MGKKSNARQQVKSYTDDEVSSVADALMQEIGITVNRNTDVWRSLRLGISKGIGMGYDKMGELYEGEQ